MITLNYQDVEIVEHNQTYAGYCKMYRYHLRHRLFVGGWSEVVVREIVERRSATAVLLYDPKQDKVILIEQFRAGALQSKHPWLIEIVAGINEPNETPDNAAYREAKEEAHLTIQQLIPIYNYWVSPGISTERINLFCGIVDATNAGGIYGLKHEQEDIRAFAVTRAEAYNLLKTGHIDNALTIIALQWLQLNHQQLKSP